MTKKAIYVGDAVRKITASSVEGGFLSLDGERYYRIGNYDQMPPFFMTIVSHSDHWMFVSSNGALTAGRRNPDHALFPYYTDDKIHDSLGITGGRTLILADIEDRLSLWEPFSGTCTDVYETRRNLYKNTCGNKLVFEEANQDLGLVFRTMWTTSERYGFVRRSSVLNVGSDPVSLRVLDGIQNILPSGTERLLQTERSTLLDAYKKNELLPESGLGLFLLSSVPVDKPEPSESLSATTVWCVGLEDTRYLLSTRQVERFRCGEPLETEIDVRAERGAFFVAGDLVIPPDGSHHWYIVADVDQGPAEVARLRKELLDRTALKERLERDVVDATNRLEQIVAEADGLQLTGDELSTGRHFSNVLFNLMRGGSFADGYQIETRDLIEFVGTHNRNVLSTHLTFLQSLPDRISLTDLLSAVADREDLDLARLCHEYLPLTYSRRHGDPSRPWNYFSIDIKGPDGTRAYNYEGNWRDIFQNWEALCISYPRFVPSIIGKFVNASTPDGYNPYRITRDGIDWEVEDPSDPWSYIGYWGDHQIVYLLKLLEISRSHDAAELQRLLVTDEFAYANVPYRIKSYEALLRDPHDTIDYDDALERIIQTRVREVGTDGRLLWNQHGGIQKANLAEKLLVPVLAKFSNFIPDAGIWMNTQRPEWNDANNALVGYGVSMVTLYYLRRFQVFLGRQFRDAEWDEIAVAEPVAAFLAAITGSFRAHHDLLGASAISDRDRKRVLDDLGGAGAKYRQRVYDEGLGELRTSVRKEALVEFIDLSLEWTDHTIRMNRRQDGLYHAYNLMTVSGEEISITYLYEMLEGQVGALSSGLLSPSESVSVLDALRESALYREDQYSYLLYPDRHLPRFDEKNRIPQEDVTTSALLMRLLADGDSRLVVRDVEGVVHFNGSFRNSGDVEAVLGELAASGYKEEADSESRLVLDLFEELFDHRSYTGRSGTFFGYEGLGCIYWHMVSKLLLTVAEIYHGAIAAGADQSTVGRLAEHYYSIRAGIGLNKTPDLYGAFPTDPYSHTPGNAGAQQPGMTGQVKEDILARWFELGAVVEDGRLTFVPSLLRGTELLSEQVEFEFVDVGGQRRRKTVDAGELVYTYCQIPIVYRKAQAPRITVSMHDGEVIETNGLTLSADLSREIFDRTGNVASIDVELAPSL